MDYKQKLKEFNSTDKYLKELQFLSSLIEGQVGQKILDYGCGVGTAMRYLQNKTGAEVYGYDVTDKYFEGDNFYFKREMWFQVDTIYFMHSIAHIPNLAEQLERLRHTFLNIHGRVVVVTPNKHFIERCANPSYVPDPTVVKHYTMMELKNIFEEARFKVKAFGQFGEAFGDIGAINERIFLIAQS